MFSLLNPVIFAKNTQEKIFDTVNKPARHSLQFTLIKQMELSSLERHLRSQTFNYDFVVIFMYFSVQVSDSQGKVIEKEEEGLEMSVGGFSGLMLLNAASAAPAATNLVVEENVIL